MQYEKPSEKDISDISILFRKSFLEKKFSKKFSERVISIYLKNPEFSLVARDKNTIVGFIYAIDDASKILKNASFLDKMLPSTQLLLVPAKKYRNDAFVILTFVDKAYRNKGIGSELINRAINQIHKPLFCQIDMKNKSSMCMIKKCGAKLVETIGIFKKYGIYEL
ncbi:GNAT family N-acetyltransferase [Candidatus Woesearchaeota archaeon]|jgi:GNAT superfamily N-acetyltransferase|nr:GNAT family N-acetyltransferase [Candidatus Woesearchaeota archaeon]MBT7063044.1 GNAT family N-acetyltransferase [Candidatus Woesearchaeota archaeon]MBT7402481.1 GNAT family N-acetyltransferase [Candidatus Woesearchaeota archaeon]